MGPPSWGKWDLTLIPYECRSSLVGLALVVQKSLQDSADWGDEEVEPLGSRTGGIFERVKEAEGVLSGRPRNRNMFCDEHVSATFGWYTSRATKRMFGHTLVPWVVCLGTLDGQS